MRLRSASWPIRVKLSGPAVGRRPAWRQCKKEVDELPRRGRREQNEVGNLKRDFSNISACSLNLLEKEPGSPK
jgi:hypothetical protein